MSIEGNTVYYRFKHETNWSVLPIDGFCITQDDFKRLVIQKRLLNKNKNGKEEFELFLLNFQTNSPYTNDERIQKNSQVVVSRIPSNMHSKPITVSNVTPVDQMTLELFEVWEVRRKSGFSNAYAVNRHEDIFLVLSKTFKTMDEARDYVKKCHSGNPYFNSLMVDIKKKMNEQEIMQILERFALDDNIYIPHRTHFIGRKNEIASLLKKNFVQNGIKIVI